MGFRIEPVSCESSYVDERQVAQMLGITRAAVRKWRLERRGPAYYKVETSVRYSVADLRAYLETHKVRPDQQ